MWTGSHVGILCYLAFVGGFVGVWSIRFLLDFILDIHLDVYIHVLVLNLMSVITGRTNVGRLGFQRTISVGVMERSRNVSNFDHLLYWFKTDKIA